MKHLSLIADDIGASDGIDESVVHLASLGIVDAAAAFTTYGSITGFALSLPKKTRLGLHLNVSSGEPLTAASRIPTLVDKDGRFHAPMHYPGTTPQQKVKRYTSSLRQSAHADEIELEFRAQFLQFVHYVGHDPEFICVHHDLDTVEKIDHSATSATGLPGRQRRLRTGTLARYEYALHPTSASLKEIEGYFQEQFLLARSTVGLTEVITHPAANTAGLESFSLYGVQRTLEFEALLNLDRNTKIASTNAV
ncbi:ChbG/HpnK family deacetylase [Rhodococcus sp. 14-1411-2a]|uniref:ChbG/HpnK family deacetylase n=1 Tax=Rhodococcus sp. 14-1411-2a TaxID=2023151 RepID=UPI0015C5A488|nr:ChbG/HpnK family deacetylase [Rhodococcus sp. 14-1411-2a]